MECPPNCIAAQVAQVNETLAKKQDEQHKEQMKILSEVTDNQKEQIKLLSDLNNLSRNFDEFKQDTKDDFDDLFRRMRILEASKISKGDIVKFMTATAAIFATLQILFKWVIS